MPSDKEDDQVRSPSHSQRDRDRKEDETEVLYHEEPKSATEVNASEDNVHQRME
jgi:hypothetical protein